MTEQVDTITASAPARARPAILTFLIPRTPYRRLTLTIWILLMGVALTLLVIGARSPYTHANLSAGYDPRYDRTSQIVVGAATGFDGVSASTATGSDPVVRGGSLYVTAGCVTCHGLEGRGSVVGPEIAGKAELDIVTQRVRQGPAGMPKFSLEALTDEQIADITAFLQSVEATE